MSVIELGGIMLIDIAPARNGSARIQLTVAGTGEVINEHSLVELYKLVNRALEAQQLVLSTSDNGNGCYRITARTSRAEYISATQMEIVALDALRAVKKNIEEQQMPLDEAIKQAQELFPRSQSPSHAQRASASGRQTLAPERLKQLAMDMLEKTNPAYPEAQREAQAQQFVTNVFSRFADQRDRRWLLNQAEEMIQPVLTPEDSAKPLELKKKAIKFVNSLSTDYTRGHHPWNRRF